MRFGERSANKRKITLVESLWIKIWKQHNSQRDIAQIAQWMQCMQHKPGRSEFNPQDSIKTPVCAHDPSIPALGKRAGGLYELEANQVYVDCFKENKIPNK